MSDQYASNPQFDPIPPPSVSGMGYE